MHSIDGDQTYLKVPVNSYTVIGFLVFMLVVSLGGNWFFGTYKLRSPIVVKLQLPFEARIPEGVKKVNADEENHKVKVTLLTPTPSPKKQAMIPVVQAEETTQTEYRKNVPISEGVAYLKKKFAEFGDHEVRVAIAISKSENAVNMHPGYFQCDIYGAQNSNGTVDLGAFQINSANWDKYGGEDNLKDCFKNWDAGYEIRSSWQNWTAWSAYNNGSYKQFINDEI